MRNILRRIYVISFIFVLAFIGLVTVIKEDTKISEYENRMLAQKPNMSWVSIKTGIFQKNYEKYLKDQLFKRNLLLYRNILLQTDVLNKKQIGSIYIANNGYLQERPHVKNPYRDSMESINQRVQDLENLNRLVKDINSDIEFYLVMPPHKETFLSNNSPHGIISHIGDVKDIIYNQLKESSIITIDIREAVFNHSNDDVNIYFKTDHHWNIEGAMAGYLDLMKQVKLNTSKLTIRDDSLENYDRYCNPNKQFVGSQNRPLMLTYPSNDYFCIYNPKYDESFTYTVLDKEYGHSFNNIYSPVKGDYGLVYGGDVSISYNFENQVDNVLVIKDSYFNIMSKYFASHFKNTYLYDVRNTNKSIESIIKENNIDAVFVIYHDNNISESMYDFIMN